MFRAAPHLLALTLALAGPVLWTGYAPGVLAQQQASLRGRVVSAENARALARARITLLADGKPLESVFADDGGRFVIGSGRIRPGSNPTIVLAIGKAGYAVQHVAVAGAGGTLTIKLARSAAVTGRIADPAGEGLVDVRVVAVRRDVAAGDPMPARFETVTDDLGDYRLGGLPPGRYDVGMEDAASTASLELRAGDEIGAVDFTRAVNELITIDARDADGSRLRSGQDGTGAISGRVSAATGRPIANAEVRVLRNGSPPRGAFTDRQGRFTIEQLPAGAYIIEASRAGYVRVQYGQKRASRPGKEVVVRDHVTAAGIDIVLSRGSAVTGTIVDEHGEPMQGVGVRPMQLRHVNGRYAALNAGPRQARTDDRGRYRIHGLLPGSYLIAAYAEAAMPGVQSRGYPPIFYPGTPQAGEASAVTTDLGRDVPGVDLVLTPTPTARVTVIPRTSDGAPFEGLVLMMASGRSGAIAVEPQRPARDRDGRFVFTNVPPGDYVVQAMRLREQNRGTSEFGARFLTIAKGDPKPLVIATSPGATFAGRFVYEGEGLTPRATERAPTIMPFPADFDRAPAVGGGTYSASTAPDGTFTMSGLFGPTRFRLTGADENWYLKSIALGGLDITDTAYDFGSAGQTAGAEVVISNAGAAISGHVTDASAAPVTSYSVVVFSTDRTRWFASSRFLKLGRPAQDGSFEVTGLPPGEYWVAATEPIEGNDISGEWLKTETLEQLSFRATRVTLTERQRVMTVLRLIRR